MLRIVSVNALLSQTRFLRYTPKTRVPSQGYALYRQGTRLDGPRLDNYILTQGGSNRLYSRTIMLVNMEHKTSRLLVWPGSTKGTYTIALSTCLYHVPKPSFQL